MSFGLGYLEVKKNKVFRNQYPSSVVLKSLKL